jgi:transcription elongation GreA/GreB family factor
LAVPNRWRFLKKQRKGAAMQKELVILDDDKVYARKRIEELEKAIQDLGPEFYEVFNQSSETWHDNAPFDALRDRQSVLAAELQQLKNTLRKSAPGVPRLKKGVVGIGSTVTLQNGNVYFVAGDWTPHAGQTFDGKIVVSCNTPIATSLLGKRQGDTVQVGRRTSVIEVVEGQKKA